MALPRTTLLRRLLLLGAAALAAACASDTAPASSAFAFALIGDAPYGAFGEIRVAASLREIEDDASIRFVLHAGDLKGGGEPCSDELLRRRLAQLQASRLAVVYTPGDNEWTDCHRAAAGRFHPLERLEALRRLAFADPARSLGQRPLALEPQSASGQHPEAVENALFTYRGVLFATLHVVGSDNGLEPWTGIDAADSIQRPRGDRLAAFEQRQAANLAWLETAFARAHAAAAPAVVLLMQANPRFDLPPGHPRRAGYEALLAALGRLAANYSGQVLLLHGDGHVFFVDWPLANATPPVANLTRVQTYGEPLVGWVRIDVDPSRPRMFVVQPGGPRRAEN